jgi:hypothetical protein
MFVKQSQSELMEQTSLICTHERKEECANLFRFSMYRIFSLFFCIMKNVEEVQPDYFPVSLFDELLTSRKHIILSFIFKSISSSVLLLIIRVFQNFALGTNWNIDV